MKYLTFSKMRSSRISQDTATGSTVSQRLTLTLTISIEKIDFDVSTGELHLSGPTTEFNKYVRIGAFHKIDLELRRQFTLIKTEWDSIALETVQEACDPTKHADVGAVVLEEGVLDFNGFLKILMYFISGLANVCLITEHMTLLRQKIKTSISRKRRGASSHETDLAKFYDTVYVSMTRNFDFEALKVILIASPGFVGEALVKYIFDQAVKAYNQVLLKSKPKFLVVHSSSGHIHSLNEILKSPQVMSQLADTKFAKESAALETFFQTLNENTFKACYGPKHVAAALEKSAIATLLISDSLFRYLYEFWLGHFPLSS